MLTGKLPRQLSYRGLWIVLFLLGITAPLFYGCNLPGNNYAGRGIIDAARGPVYGAKIGPYQYPQNSSESWETTNPGLNQQTGMNPYQDPRLGQGMAPPDYGGSGINPGFNAAQTMGGNPQPVGDRYLDENTRRAIANMQSVPSQSRENTQYQESYSPPQQTTEMQGEPRGMAGYPIPAENPVVTRVGVSEIGIPIGTNPSSNYDRISGNQLNPEAVSAGAQTSGMIPPPNPAPTTAGNINSNRELPTLQVPVPPGINQGYLTQPAVGIPPNYGGSESIIVQRERFLAEHPEDINTALALYYHYLADGNQHKAQTFLPRDFGSADLALENLADLRRQISERALLKVSNLKVCQKVDGFGRYLELPMQELASGQSRWIEVYFELENFVSRLNSEGLYRTEIHAEITLYNSSYQPMIPPLTEDVPDKPTHSTRNDFFLVGTIQLPALTPGRYIIAVQVEDKLAQKRSRRQELVFQVGGAVGGIGYGQTPIR